MLRLVILRSPVEDFDANVELVLLEREGSIFSQCSCTFHPG